MKTKQNHIKAVFTEEASGAKNYSGAKGLLSIYKIVCRKTEKVVVDCRVWSNWSSANTAYCSVWVSLAQHKKPDAWEWAECSGSSTDNGCGYDRVSQVVASALCDAGIEFYGSPYPANKDAANFKKRAYIGGTGCHVEALLAVAYAAGFNDCILVKY